MTEDTPKIEVIVRWHDGCSVSFDCQDVRVESDLLLMRLMSTEDILIPLTSVRWFSVSPESHEEPMCTTVKPERK